MTVAAISILFAIFFLSITFHEYSHGWMASRLGDPTPKNLGRLTLNPLAHIDPFGTLILPFLLSLVPGVLPFGYAKPLPINPRYFKNPKQGSMWVGLAGPTMNFGIAGAFSVLLHFLTPSFFSDVVVWAIIANLLLAVFNLLPIPPLDGSRVVAWLLPYKLSYKYLRLQFYGFLAIIVLIHLGFFRWFIIPAIKFFFLLFGISHFYPL